MEILHSFPLILRLRSLRQTFISLLTHACYPAVSTSSREPIFRLRVLEWHATSHPESHPGDLRQDYDCGEYCSVLQHELDVSRRWYGPSPPSLWVSCDRCLLTEFSIAVIESLDAFSDDKWVLRSTIQTRMYGSNAQHTAWVIDRIRLPRIIPKKAVARRSLQ
jgi:hypothetical protein